ncbi:MAG: DMT family transporter [Spongiibacteraceae bacterium]|nr:DMT family transporter [Spongiibacteraceae bacterium]
MNYLSLLAFLSGVAIATQASMNAQLGSLLKSPLLAASVAFSSSVFFTLCAVLVCTKNYPSLDSIKAVPTFLWFSGGVLSAFGISIFYYLIPKMGIASMMSFALSGQLVFAVLAGHFAWFGLGVRPISLSHVAGVMAMVVGISLINKG